MASEQAERPWLSVYVAALASTQETEPEPLLLCALHVVNHLDISLGNRDLVGALIDENPQDSFLRMNGRKDDVFWNCQARSLIE
ncbi:hypothetical protein CDD83_7678 [Cordyceps sp. RAO-2017]|nr:hypothetical protein CDD83_7678 [Cordyceps sp. RAO-2017]